MYILFRVFDFIFKTDEDFIIVVRVFKQKINVYFLYVYLFLNAHIVVNTNNKMGGCAQIVFSNYIFRNTLAYCVISIQNHIYFTVKPTDRYK